MTLERMVLLAALGMLATGVGVYSLTSPGPPPLTSEQPSVTASMDERAEPAPLPRDVAPAPSDTAPRPTVAPAPPPPLLPSAPASAHPPSTVTSTPSLDALLAAATSALATFARTEAPGMAKDGQPIAGTFAQGSVLERGFTLRPGKCYAALAVGIGVVEVDVFLIVPMTPTGVPGVIQGTLTGSLDSVGGKGNCYKGSAPFDLQARLAVKAASGTGVIVAQLYVR